MSTLDTKKKELLDYHNVTEINLMHGIEEFEGRSVQTGDAVMSYKSLYNKEKKRLSGKIDTFFSNVSDFIGYLGGEAANSEENKQIMNPMKKQLHEELGADKKDFLELDRQVNELIAQHETAINDLNDVSQQLTDATDQGRLVDQQLEATRSIQAALVERVSELDVIIKDKQDRVDCIEKNLLKDSEAHLSGLRLRNLQAVKDYEAVQVDIYSVSQRINEKKILLQELTEKQSSLALLYKTITSSTQEIMGLRSEYQELLSQIENIKEELSKKTRERYLLMQELTFYHKRH